MSLLPPGYAQHLSVMSLGAWLAAAFAWTSGWITAGAVVPHVMLFTLAAALVLPFTLPRSRS